MSQSSTTRRGTVRNVLSVDGCGFRGLTQLLVLQRLMELHGAQSHPPKPQSRPCDVFDLICGTATGGLIAILLGRLGMTCAQAIDAYTYLESTIFDTSPPPLPAIGSQTFPQPATPPRPTIQDILVRSSFSTSTFQAALERIIQNFAGTPDAPMVRPPTQPQGGAQSTTCRTVVTVVPTSAAADVDADRIRSYPAPRRQNGTFDPGPTPPTQGGWTIFHAALGTASCPRLFDPLDLNQNGFMAANTSGFSNPSMVAYLEALDLFGEDTPLTLISLGMGLRDLKQYGNLSQDGTDAMLNQLLAQPGPGGTTTQLPVDTGLRDRLRGLIGLTQLAATSTEVKHSRLYELIGRKFKQEYMRFDPARGNNPFVFIDYVQIPQIQSFVHAFFNDQNTTVRLDEAVELIQGVASKWIQLPGYTCGDPTSPVPPVQRPGVNIDAMDPPQIMRECYRWEEANPGQYIRCFSISSGGVGNTVEFFTGEVAPTHDDDDSRLYVRVLLDDEWLFIQERVTSVGDWKKRIGNGSLRDPIDIIVDATNFGGIQAFRSDGRYTKSTGVTSETVKISRFEFTHPYHGTWVRNDRR